MTRLVCTSLLALALSAFPARRAAADECGICLRGCCGGYLSASISCSWTGCGCAPCYGFGPCFTPAYVAWGLPAPNDQGGYPGYPGSPYNYHGAAYGFPPPAPGSAYGAGAPSYWYGH
jgi:hypothetical protein